MNRFTRGRYLRVAALSVLALMAVVLTGCSSAGSADSGMEAPKVWGYVVDASDAQLEVSAQSEPGMLVVGRVLAPVDGWIVVHLDENDMPGDRVGLKRISKGESLNVRVPLAAVTTAKVIVSVHADRGTANEFDFDMMQKEASPDRPLFVAGEELAKSVAVRQGEATTSAGQPSESAAPMDSPQAMSSPEKSAPKQDSTMDSAVDSTQPEEAPMDSDSGQGAPMGGESPGDAPGQEDSGGMGDDEAMGEGSAASQPAWGVLIGFLILNVAIIAFAAVLRRRGATAGPEGS